MSSKKTKKEKPKKNRSSKNLKISTRIFLTAILGILIPIILIGAFSPLLIYFTGSYFNISSVTTNSYSTVNQIQWSQTISSISNALLSDENDKKKTESLSEFISPIERLGSSIYIEKNGKPFYSSSKSDILKEANEIVNVNKDENLNYFGNNGLVIVTHANSKSDKYLIVAVNKNYTVKNASTHYAAKEFTNLLLGRTGIIALIIVAVFVLAIVIISFITSKTIVNPIKKIADGADEIARGNLDYEIDYKSKNELGQTVESFNQMRLRLKNSIEKQNKADEQRKELIAGIAHDRGKGIIIAVNKWDAIEKDNNTVKKHTEKIRQILSFMPYAEILFISAKSGQRLNKIFEMIDVVIENNSMRVATGVLNEIVTEAVAMQQPPTDKGKRLKIYYVTQVAVKPPTFVVFVNDKNLMHFSYTRYLENRIRDTFGFRGTALKFITRERKED